jgi:hypothetical protein
MWLANKIVCRDFSLAPHRLLRHSLDVASSTEVSSSSCGTANENPFQLFVTDLAKRYAHVLSAGEPNPTCRTAQDLLDPPNKVYAFSNLETLSKLQPFFGRHSRNGLCQPPRSPARCKWTFTQLRPQDSQSAHCSTANATGSTSRATPLFAAPRHSRTPPFRNANYFELSPNRLLSHTS